MTKEHNRTEKSPGLPSFSSRWLAEVVRLQEEARPSLGPGPDDAEAERHARAQTQDSEQRIVDRAYFLAERSGALQALLNWRMHARWTLLALAVLATVSGFSAALTVLGDSGRPVNVVWALGALLGLNVLMFILWFLNMLFAGRAAGGSLGRFWLWLSRRFSGSDGVYVSHAFSTLSARAGLTRWYLAAVTHGLWSLLLVAALAGLLIALALRSYSFVWETTILPAEAFVRFVQVIGWLPAQLGFAIPDAELIRRSGVAATGGAGSVTLQSETQRLAWSSWLIGTLLVYGILPRLIALLICGSVLRRALSGVRLDLQSAAYARLAARLSPNSERGGVTDPEPGSLASAKLSSATGRLGKPALLGLELGARSAWPPLVAANVRTFDSVESREQRAAARNRLREEPAARLLVACDSNLSPDRGSLHWLAELSAFAGQTRIWLLNTESTDAQRYASWQESLTDLGFARQQIMVDETAALNWLAAAGTGGADE